MSRFEITTARNAGFDREIDTEIAALAQEINERRFPPLQDYRDLRPGEPDPSGAHGPEAVRRYLHLARPRYNLIVQWLRPLAGALVADIGASYGFLDLVLADRYGLRCTVTEHPDNIAAYSGLLRARGIEPVPWQIGRESSPLERQMYSAVIFAEVLEHLKLPPLRTLHEVTGLLHRGGTLILTTPNIGRQSNIERLRRGENILEPFREDIPPERDVTNFVSHIREYSVQEVVDLVEAAGLRIGELAFCNWRDEPLHDNPLRNRYTCVRAVKK